MKSKIQTNQILKKGMSILLLIVMFFSVFSGMLTIYAAEASTELELELEEEPEFKTEDQLLDIQTSIEDLENKLNNFITTEDTYENFVDYINECKRAKKEIVITKEFQLRALSLYVASGNNCSGLVFAIKNNIVLDTEQEWEPIGNSTNQFKGTLDGRGYTISGMVLTRKRSYVGLVGYLGTGGTVKNITIGSSGTTIDLGVNIDDVENDLISDTDSKYKNLGAVVGAANNASIINCTNNANVSGGSNVGGVVGYFYGKSTIEDCVNTGSVIGYSRVGGVVGVSKQGDVKVDSLKITRCINKGTVYGILIDVGGISGNVTGNGDVKQCLNQGTVALTKSKLGVKVLGINRTLTPQNVGGIIGTTGGNGVIPYEENKEKYTTVDIRECINGEAGKIYGYMDVGGIVGQLVNKNRGYSKIIDSINYCSNITSGYKTSAGYTTRMGGIAGCIGTDKVKVREGYIYNCYYMVDDEYYYQYLPEQREYRTTEEALKNDLGNIGAIGRKITTESDSSIKYSFRIVDKYYYEGYVYDSINTEIVRVYYFRDDSGKWKTSISSIQTLDEDITKKIVKPFKAGKEDELFVVSSDKNSANYQLFLTRLGNAFSKSNNSQKLAVDSKGPVAQSVEFATKDGNDIAIEGDTIVFKVAYDENIRKSGSPKLTFVLKYYNEKTSGYSYTDRRTAKFVGVDGNKAIFEYVVTKNDVGEPDDGGQNRVIVRTDSGYELKVSGGFSDIFGNENTENVVKTFNHDNFIVLKNDFNKSKTYTCREEGRIGTVTYRFQGEPVHYEGIKAYMQDGFQVKVTINRKITTEEANKIKLKIDVTDGPIVVGKPSKVNEKTDGVEIFYNNISTIGIVGDNKLNYRIIREVYLTTDAAITVGSKSVKLEKANTVAITNSGEEDLYIDNTAPSITMVNTDKKVYGIGETIAIKMIIRDRYTLKEISQTTLPKLMMKFGDGTAKEVAPTSIKEIDESKDYAREMEVLYEYKVQQGDQGALKVYYAENNGVKAVYDVAENALDLVSKTFSINKSADTSAPTVTINAKKVEGTTKTNITNNITNAETLEYTFTWSEKVEGFTFEDIIVNNGTKGTLSNAKDNGDGTYSYTMNITPDVQKGNVGPLKVAIEQNACEDAVTLGNVRAEKIITIDKDAPTLNSYNVSMNNNKITVEAIFNESISTATTDNLSIKIGNKTAVGTIENPIISGDKVTYVYNVSGADGGNVDLTLVNKVKDIAGNESEQLNVKLENEIVLEKHVIKVDNIEYSFAKNNKAITDFSEPTYFKAGDKIKVTKNAGSNTPVETYEYTVVAGENGHMKFMIITPAVEEPQTPASVSFATSGSGINISAANIWFDTTAPTLTTKMDAKNPNTNGIYEKGEEFVITTTTSEAIKEGYTIPEISIEFGGKPSKFNNGKAQYVSTLENENGTTTWVYRYVVTEGDNGQISLTYASGSMNDLAGNTTDMTKLNLIKPTFGNNNLSQSVVYDSNTKTNLEYKVYKNGFLVNKFDSNTYFVAGDSIRVETTLDKKLYSSWINKQTITTENAPKLSIKIGNKTLVEELKAGNVSFTNDYKTVLTYTYTINETDHNGKITNLVITKPEVYYIEDSEHRIGDVSNNNVGNVTISRSTTGVTTNIEDCNLVVDIIKANEKFITNEIKVDTTVPTVEITAKKVGTTKIDITNSITNADTIEYTFTWSEEVVGFTPEDIIVNKGTKGELSEVEVNNDGTYSYTMNVIPNIALGNVEEVQVSVEKNACQDKVGLSNVRTESKIIVDKVAPTVEIKANKEKVNGTEKITYEFIWNESVSGFDVSDISVAEGSKGTFTGSGNYYTLEVTPTGANDVEVSVAKDKCIDVAENNNLQSSKHVVPVYPTVEITADVGNSTNKSEITYTFKWSELVTGFGLEDIIVPNGVSKGTLTPGSNNTYTMKINYNGIIPLGNEGEVTVAVKENAAQDANGNYNSYASITTKIDRIAPIFIGLESFAEYSIKINTEVDTVKQYYKAGDKAKIVAIFTENIENSTAPVLALQFSESGNAKGTVTSGVKSGNKITYTYTITEEDTGVLSVKGFTGKVEDSAGNETVVTKRELTGDTIIADTTTIKLEKLTAIAPDFEYDELLQDGETKRYGVASKTREKNTITIIAEYSENVYNLSSNKVINYITDSTDPILKIKFGTGSERTASFSKAEGNKIYYTYDIKSGDNGNLSIVSLSGTVSDIAGNTLTTSTSVPTLDKYEAEIIEENKVTNIVADTTKSTITFDNPTAVNYDDNKNVITGNGNYYRKGAVITITASTNEYVYKNINKSLVRFTKETAPTLNISFATTGTGVGTCTKVEYKDNKTIFTYTYVIKENDNGQLKLNIATDLGFDIALNGNNAKTESKSIYADTVNPVTNWQSWVESEKYGIIDNQDGTWKVTFSEKIYVYDDAHYVVGSVLSNSNKDKAPILLVSKDNVNALETTITGITTEVINGIEKTVITYRYSDYTKNTGVYGMKFASVSDKAGNVYNFKDQQPPVLEKIEVTSPITGTYKAGEKITIVATFNEKLNEDSQAPILALKFDKSGDAKGTVSRGVIEDKKITYTYTITAYDNKGNGDNGVLQIKSYTGTGLKDLSDNIWVAPATTTLSGYRITADTISAVITKVEAKVNDTVIGRYPQNPEDHLPEKTNADTINYVITFSENVEVVNNNAIEVLNGKKVDITCENNIVTVITKTTTEGVQSLIINENAVEDVAGNANEYFRFNGITTDFTKPTVRFISEYNGGVYVIPTSINKIEIRPNVEINEDISAIEYKWDNTEYTLIEKYSSASDIAIPTKEFNQSGTYILYIKVVDIAGNVTIASKEYTVKTSGINMVPSITEPTNQDVLVTVEFDEGLTDNRKVVFKVDGSNEYKGISPEANGYRIIENGTIYAEATDKVGNKVFIERTITNIDKDAPEVELSINGENLVIGTGKETATIKSKVKVSDKNSVEIKYIYSNNEILTDDEKAAMQVLNNNEEAIKADAVAGTYYLHVIAKDAAGTEKVVKSSPFVVANSNTLKDEEGNVIFAPAEENTIKFSREKQLVYVTYGANLTENKTIEFTNENDGDAFDGYAEVLKPTTITAKASDACGNIVFATYVVESVEGPKFEVVGNSKEWTNQDIKLQVYAQDELKALTVNGTDILANGYYLAEQNGDYEFIAIDIYGNISKQTIKVTKIDKVAPVITKAEVSGNNITITATDELSGVVKYAITKTTEVPVEWSDSNVIKTTEDGTFYVWAMDGAGNITRSEESVKIDTTAPIVTFSYLSQTVTVGMPLETNIITNEDTIISYSWDNKNWVNSENVISRLSVSEKSTTPGKYTLYVKAKDSVGNESKVQTLEFTVLNIEEIRQPQIIFEDLPTMQINGAKYIRISPTMNKETLIDAMNKEALCGKVPEYTNLTKDNTLKTGSEIKLNGETKYIVIVSGDVNCDGKVDFLGDVVMANNYRIGQISLNTIQRLAADINQNGSVEFIPDVVAINNYRLGIIKSL